MADEARKRSRFDQSGSDGGRRSRFDRRSRSPSEKHRETRRSRSPLSHDSTTLGGSEGKKEIPSEASAKLAAITARINASIQAKAATTDETAPRNQSDSINKTPANKETSVSADVYTQDGDFIKDIEINDLRNRYTLTKGHTQKTIKDATGADVTTRGEFYPDKSMATPAAPPLYLHVTSTTKEGLDKAIAMIEELMQQQLPNLVDERRFRRREPEQVERDEQGRRKWPDERIPIDLEPIPGFNLRAQVVGAGGAYVKHIQQEARCRVQIKGRGSGFTEGENNQESDEPMYLHVHCPDPESAQKARELCMDLLKQVKNNYEEHKERGPPRRYGGGGRDHYGNRGGGHGGYGRGGHNGSHYNNNYSAGYGNQDQPSQAGAASQQPAAAGMDYNSADYNAQIAQYYGGQDPYAQYGGYQNYCKLYYEYMQQQGEGASNAPGTVPDSTGAPGTAGTTPVPTNASPATPAAAPGTYGSAAPGTYSNVPPPPGL